MVFLRDFLRNLAILIAFGLVIYFTAPDFTKQVFQLSGAFLGLIAMLLVIVAALPRKKRTKRC